MRLKRTLLWLIIYIGAFLILGTGVAIGFWQTVATYDPLLKEARDKADGLFQELDARYAQELDDLEAEHARKMRWLQNRQNVDLERERQEQELDLRRAFRNGLYTDCWNVLHTPDRFGFVRTDEFIAKHCNTWAKDAWEKGYYELKEPDGIDHDFIKGQQAGLRSG